MSKQTIRKSKPKNRYMTLPNKTAQDLKLSYEALGLLTYIQSLPDDWVLHVSTLPREKCGRDKAYKIIAELIEKGYAKRTKVLNDKKQVVTVEYEISDYPEFLTTNPLPEKPYTEKPDMENQELQRKEVKKEIEYKDSIVDYATIQESKNRAISEKPRDRLFDGVSFVCFGIKADDSTQKEVLKANSPRIGKLVKFLKSVECSPEKLWQFHTWYCSKYPNTSFPTDLAKFTKHFNDFMVQVANKVVSDAQKSASYANIEAYSNELRMLKD